MTKSSIHILPVKNNSESHNNREKDLDYVNKDLSKNNEHYSEEAISKKLAEIKKRVKEKTGRKMQAKANLIREGVFIIDEKTTMNDCKKMAKKLEEKKGIKTFQIHMHKDEGHEDKFGNWKPNLHAHILFDWTDHESGKSLKLNRKDFSEIQDIVAEELNLERGLKTNKIHINSKKFKAMQQEENNYYKEKVEKTEKALSKKIKNEKEGEQELENIYPTYKKQKELSEKLEKVKERENQKEENKEKENSQDFKNKKDNENEITY